MEDLYSIKIGKIYATIRSEGWAFILVCTYLFFEYVRPQSIYPQLDGLPWGFASLFLATIIAIAMREFSSSPNANDKLITAYGLVVLLSSMVSHYPDISLSRLRVFFDWFFIYFVVTRVVNNERRFFIFILSFLLYSLKMSQHGLLSWARAGFVWLREGVTGAPGWFQNSGEVGIQMCIFVPLAIAFMIGIYKYVSKCWLLFFSLMPITGIGTVIATSSRGAMIGLVAAGIWSILKRPKQFVLGAIALCLIAVAVIHFIPTQSMSRFQAIGSDPDSLGRLELWRAGIDAMNRYPLLGIGFEAWTPYYRNTYMSNRPVVLMHNMFVQCGSELGYTGLLIFLLMILACFRNTRQVRRLSRGKEDRFLRVLSFGLDSALIGFLVSGFFVTVLYYPYFWIHCAFTNCLNTAANKKFAGSS